MAWSPVMVREVVDRQLRSLRLGDPLVDDYLRLVAARARPNTWLAVAFDLKVFFTVVGKPPSQVTTQDVFAFIAEQRQPRRGASVVRLEDGERGLSARTIKRRLSSVAGFYGYLLYRDDAEVDRSPVPRGMPTRRASHHDSGFVAPLIRTPRTLPRVVTPQEAAALLNGLRTRRDQAMVLAMLLGGLRRCEVLGLRLEDVRLGERRLFIVDGKGGHQRLVSISPRFLKALGEYLDLERPSEGTTDSVFVALRGPRRGLPLSAAGLDDVMSAACRRAELPRRITCHQLRHTCLTRLREGGMALEAVQAQAGHRSIETTKLYLHLADGWVAEEYWKALAAIDGDASASVR